MQCSGCGYISFKKEKDCGACGFKFKKSTQGSQSLAGKESFTIFTKSVKGQREDNSAIESVGLLGEQEPTSFIDPETGNFNLDLPATSEEIIEEAQISSKNTEYESLEFDLDEDIELEEVEGLDLHPLHTTETLEEPEADTTEMASISLDTAVDSIEELTIDEPIAIDETASVEPVLEIGEPDEEPLLSIEPPLEISEPEKTISFEPALEIGELENSVGLLGEQEPTSFIDPETGNFNLDLPATSEEIIEEAQISSKNTEYESLEFDLDEDIELEEVEGLDLHPLHTTETLEEPEADTTEMASISLDTAVDSIEELTIDEPIAIDETASVVEPVLEIGEPDEEPLLSIETPLEISEPEKTISLEPALEIGEPEETPSIEPALELGKNEIALDLDDNPSITPAPPVAAAPLDEVELSLEIDDSDDPLTIQSQDIPDLEIEDLGLELESSDDPAADKP